MAARNCADIETNASPEYIKNVSTAEESDWEFLKEVWRTFFPTIRLEWIDDLQAAPGYSNPPWIGWTNEEDGWTPPPLPNSDD